jgi:uncharacterized membrane protein
MKRLYALALGAVVAFFVGCENKSTPGGPGATHTGGQTHRPVVGMEDNTFKLETPTLATTVHQGETKEIDISIKRGKNFAQDVALSFSGAPAGVKITPEKNEIKAGDDKVRVKIEASKEAALGDHEITVTGKPKEGPEATSKFKVDVKKPS